MYRHLADAVLIVHTCVVAFVVLGLALTGIGACLRWRWVRNGWFRLGHLACIAMVVAQSWAGVLCPLTSLEMWLRARAGDSVYEGSFIQQWLQWLLYYRAPPWVFIVAYSVFGALVILAWVRVPPDLPWRERPRPDRTDAGRLR